MTARFNVVYFGIVAGDIERKELSEVRKKGRRKGARGQKRCTAKNIPFGPFDKPDWIFSSLI